MSREQLEQSLFRARRAAKWSMRFALLAALVLMLGIIAFASIRDSRSLAADIAAVVVIVSGNLAVLGLLVYSGNRYTSATVELKIKDDDERRKAEQIAKTRQNLTQVKKDQPLDEWIENRIRPEPQPYGVSDEGAEHLTAQWLQYLGFEEATVTQYSGDGGIDVETLDYVCQVKNYRDKAVSVTEVRELFGVAASERKRAILFTASGVTTQAIQFADKNGIALIRFDAKAARLEEINDEGSDLLVNGEYEDL